MLLSTDLKYNSPIPLYTQIARILEDAIRNGTFTEGEKLPSESQLCTLYNISRITVRQALKELETKDLTYSVVGKGTFVKLPALSQGLLKITTFKKTLEQKGLKGHTEIAYFGAVKDNTKKVKKVFELTELEDICQLNLVGFGNKTPFVFYKSYFRNPIGKAMHQAAQVQENLSGFSTFDLYNELEIEISEITQNMYATNADKSICQRMQLPANQALLMLESFVYDANAQLIEYKIGYYRSDKYHFTITREIE